MRLTITSESILPCPSACAAYGGHRDIINFLVGREPRPVNYFGHRSTVVRWAGKGGHDELVDMAMDPSWHDLPFYCPMDDHYANLIETKSLKTLRHFLPGLEKWMSDPARIPPLSHAPLQVEYVALHKKFFAQRLVSAAAQGSLDIVLYLLQELNAPVERYSAYWRGHAPPIFEAAKGGHTELVRLFLDAKPRLSGGELENAAASGSVDTVRLLLERIDWDELMPRIAVRKAAEREHDSVIRLFKSFNVHLDLTDETFLQHLSRQ